MFKAKGKTLKGACTTTYWYDLGQVHGKDSAKNAIELAKKMDGKIRKLNIAITNNHQDIVRKQLEQLGFEKIRIPNSVLWLHYATFENIHSSEPMKKLNEIKKEEYKQKQLKNCGAAWARVQSAIKSKSFCKIRYSDFITCIKYYRLKHGFPVGFFFQKTELTPVQPFIKELTGFDIKFKKIYLEKYINRIELFNRIIRILKEKSENNS